MTLTSYVSKRSKGYFGQKQRYVRPQLRLHQICTAVRIIVLTETSKPFYFNVQSQWPTRNKFITVNLNINRSQNMLKKYAHALKKTCVLKLQNQLISHGISYKYKSCTHAARLQGYKVPSPSKANSSPGGQEIPSTLWKPELRHRV
jgi:hypothetical protein